jgi:uncharacterized membrane protein
MKIFSILLILAGAGLIYLGSSRQDSIAGASQSVGKEIATAVDGKPRVADHTLYYVGGGVLILAGVIGAVRKRA